MSSLSQIHDNYQSLILIDGADLGSNYTSTAYDISSMDMGSMQFNYDNADTKKGKFLVEVSNDGVRWMCLYPEGSEKATALGTGLVHGYTMESLTYKYIRARYEANTVSTGTFSAILFLKRRRGNNP